MDIFLLPFRALAMADRVANRLYISAMAKFLVLVLSYLGILWVGALADWQWLTIGAMWLYTIVVFVTYLQPNIAGVLSIAEWVRGGDNPNKSGVIRGGLLLIVTVITIGGEALIAGFIGAGKVFPLAVLVTILAVASAVAVGASQLEVWLPRITKVGVAILVLATLSGLMRENPEVMARAGVDTRALKVRPSETKRLENAEADREIRDLRELKKAKSVAMLQECRVPDEAVAKFSVEQSAIYKQACDGTSGMTLDEVYRGWPGLKPGPARSPHGETGTGGAGAQAGKPEFLSDPMGWTTYMVAREPIYFWSLILGHILGIWAIKWLWGKVKKDDAKDAKDTKAKTSDSSGLMTLLIIGALALGVYALYDNYVVNASPDAPLVKPVPAISVQHAERYDVHINTYIDLPHTAVAGKSFAGKLSKGSYVSEVLKLRVVFPEGQDLDITLDGQCSRSVGTAGRACSGNYETRYGHSGTFEAVFSHTGGLLEVSLKDPRDRTHAIATLLIEMRK